VTVAPALLRERWAPAGDRRPRLSQPGIESPATIRCPIGARGGGEHPARGARC
jgi:hypothetical protein